ncbi:MAG: hypothetical protein DMF67_07100 [Acidobacteria bacterium]|nr:MAG: hypothetical protein DMF67_07100 [Acidobacteriota bacterium]
MFCPKCGANQSDELRFCKTCGANLYAVRQVVDTREADEKFDWSKTWVAEMFLSEAERKRRAAELEIQRGIMLINGVFVSKRQAEIARRAWQSGPDALAKGADARALRSADTSEFIPSDFSVTEGTTKHLSTPAPKPSDTTDN